MNASEAKVILKKIAEIAADRKGEDIRAYDLSAAPIITDYVLIVQGNVGRHVSAICEDIIKAMRGQGLKPFAVEGMGDSDWVVIDYGNIIVHVLTPGHRELYKLEELWSTGLPIDMAKSG